MEGWRLGGEKRWRKMGKRVYCGEGDNITVRIAGRRLPAVCDCGFIAIGQPYADYWLIGRKHSKYCLSHAPFVIEFLAENGELPASLT